MSAESFDSAALRLSIRSPAGRDSSKDNSAEIKAVHEDETVAGQFGERGGVQDFAFGAVGSNLAWRAEGAISRLARHW